ncbi:hypothetical protein EIN_016390 [Entamoeba invadens IP1]|uniref:hypothetical protein n=1 Tax=Entamoeba invadens IP1 TaxID=370355 RepID=UPI0002C3F69F|nr:hypothetical protein EIN_016390 [Entamoeba invadens IP1]ELP90420.1 hypothetical protein EIN_016390 [Entamoeba invadens IP1]|eukprot:XP_004257191.1 hypothetical protein EIN_016390 [Entamoeba invadens IP1]
MCHGEVKNKVKTNKRTFKLRNTQMSYIDSTQPQEPCQCLLCQRGFVKFARHPTWKMILRVVFCSLQSIFPEKEYFSLTTDVYLYIELHMPFFKSIKHFQSKPQIWKKAMIDSLSHNKDFLTGFPLFGMNGFWKLINKDDPWMEEDPVQKWRWTDKSDNNTQGLRNIFSGLKFDLSEIESTPRKLNSEGSVCVDSPINRFENCIKGTEKYEETTNQYDTFLNVQCM